MNAVWVPAGVLELEGTVGGAGFAVWRCRAQSVQPMPICGEALPAWSRNCVLGARRQ